MDRDSYEWIEMVLEHQHRWLDMAKYVYTYLLLEIGEMEEIDEMVDKGLHFAHLARATILY